MKPEETRPEIERSLALHREVAVRLRDDPKLLTVAIDRVDRWLDEGSVESSWALAWKRLLAEGLDSVVSVLTEQSQSAHDLRQVSPFAGVLDPRTRWRILRACSSPASMS